MPDSPVFAANTSMQNAAVRAACRHEQQRSPMLVRTGQCWRQLKHHDGRVNVVERQSPLRGGAGGGGRRNHGRGGWATAHPACSFYDCVLWPGKRRPSAARARPQATGLNRMAPFASRCAVRTDPEVLQFRLRAPLRVKAPHLFEFLAPLAPAASLRPLSGSHPRQQMHAS